MSDIHNDKIDTKTATLDKEKDNQSKEDANLKAFETHPADVGGTDHVDILTEQSQFQQLPPAGRVDASVTAIQAQSDRGSGVSTARPYTVVSGAGSMDGLMYTNSSGSTFKSLDGTQAYRVDFQKDGTVNLEPQNAASRPIADAQLQRSSNPLNDTGEPVVRPKAAPPEAPPPEPAQPPQRLSQQQQDAQPVGPGLEPKVGQEVKEKAPVELSQSQSLDQPPGQPRVVQPPRQQDTGAGAEQARMPTPSNVANASAAGNDLNFAPASAGAAGGVSAEQQQRRTEQAAAPLVVAQQFVPRDPVEPKKADPIGEIKDKQSTPNPQPSTSGQSTQSPPLPRTNDNQAEAARGVVPADGQTASRIASAAGLDAGTLNAAGSYALRGQSEQAAVLKGNVAETNIVTPGQRASLDAASIIQAGDAKRLQQFGLDASDPQTAAFLLAARQQLLPLKDGVPQNLTLAQALSGLNQQNADRLAAFLMHNSDATANSVILNNSLLARMNVMYTTDRTAVAADRQISGQKLVAEQLADSLRNQSLTEQQGLGTQGTLYAQLNRLLTGLNNPADTNRPSLTVADLLNRSLAQPGGAQSFVLRADNVIVAGRVNEQTPLPLAANQIPGLEPITGRQLLPGTATSEPGKVEISPIVRTDLTTAGKVDIASVVKADLTTAGKADLITTGKADAKVDASKAGKDLVPDAAQARANAPGQDVAGRMTDAMIAAASRDNKVSDAGEKVDQSLEPTTKPQADELDEHGQPKKKEEKPVVQDQKLDAAMMALIAARKLKEEKDLKEKEDQQEKDKKKKEDSQRRKYIVKEKDTLESIALKQCRDVRLAALIFEINQEVLQASPGAPTKDGKELLVPGTAIWLPSVDDIQEFRVKLVSAASAVPNDSGGLSPEEELAARFGPNWSAPQAPDKVAQGQDFRVSLLAAAVEASKKRRQNVENLLGPLAPPKEEGIRYVVRLGDSLKSIAMKHPGLQDVALWELLAQINNISTECDARGIPLEKLSRGMKIRIPNLQEINDFKENCQKADAQSAAAADSSARKPAITLTLPAQAPQSDAASKMLSAGGFDNRPTISEAKEQREPNLEKPTITAKEIDTQAATASKGKAIENIRKLSDDCRIVRRHLANADGSRCYQAQLDILVRNAWQTVIIYNISDNDNWVKRLGIDGGVEKAKLDLPVPAIHQMLENDFSGNWQDYRDLFISS